MRKKNVSRLVALLMFVVPLVPLTTQAMGQDSNQDSMAGMNMADTGNDSKMVMLKSDVRAGVSVAGHLIDIREVMAENGMSQTHHLMVSFTGSGGKQISEGRVALKVITPDGSSTKAATMMSMGGSFGSDVTIAKKGQYVFEIGTKFADGAKRVFKLHYHTK